MAHPNEYDSPMECLGSYLKGRKVLRLLGSKPLAFSKHSYQFVSIDGAFKGTKRGVNPSTPVITCVMARHP